MKLRYAAFVAALLCAGCATNPTPDVASFAQNSGRNSFEMTHRAVTSPQALVLPVVHDRQIEGPACGAHAMASVVNYWRGQSTLSGSALFRQRPPANALGYSMAEMLSIAQGNQLQASAVVLPQAALIRELEAGRPVIVPVRLPSIYVQNRVLPNSDFPPWNAVRNAWVYGAARVSERAGLAMVDHYLVIVGYQDDTFVVVEPVIGYRTLRNVKLERWRAAFGDAAIVLSRRGGRAQATAP